MKVTGLSILNLVSVHIVTAFLWDFLVGKMK